MSKEFDVMQAEPPAPQPKKKRPPIRLIVGCLLGILVITLVVQNRQPVETKILWATVEMPRAVLLLTTFILGIIVGLLIAYIRGRQIRT